MSKSLDEILTDFGWVCNDVKPVAFAGNQLQYYLLGPKEQIKSLILKIVHEERQNDGSELEIAYRIIQRIEEL